MKKLLLLLILCNSFELTFAKKSNDVKKSSNIIQATETAPKTPILLIKSLTNYTPYDLVMVDRSNNTYFHLASGYTYNSLYKIENYQKIILDGSMLNCMEQQAQFIIGVADDEGPERGAYFNIYVGQGGIRNGSGIMTGSKDKLSLDFFIAGTQGGCSMSTRSIQDTADDELAIHLEFFIDEQAIKNNIFKLYGKCSTGTNNNIETTVKTNNTTNSTLDVRPEEIDSQENATPIDDNIQSEKIHPQSITEWISHIHENYSVKEKLFITAAIIYTIYEISSFIKRSTKH